MEFFQCSCSERARVILDGRDQGFNKDDSGNLLTKQCNAGLHSITLVCLNGKKCTPELVELEIKDTDPIMPMEVSFQCQS